MKLLQKAIDIIDSLEEGVGEPQPFPMAGNVAYYSSVDEVKGEWGPWVYDEANGGAWAINSSELEKYEKDPWGRKMDNMEFQSFEKMPEDEATGDIKGWKTDCKSPNGKDYTLIIWNDNG